MAPDLREVLFYSLIGYLFGSISNARMAGALAGVDVIGDSSDHNPGGANVFDLVGKTAGVAVVVLDILKGFLPVYFYHRIYSFADPASALVVVSPVLGHAFPFYDPARGGKAIASSFGCLMGLWPAVLPLAALIVLYVFFSAVLVIEPHAMRSITTYLIFGTSCLFFDLPKGMLGGCLLMAMVVIARHVPSAEHERVRVALFRNPEKKRAGRLSKK